MELRRLATIVISALLSFAACNDSRLEGVEGRWEGEIVCLGDTSEISLSLKVEEELIYGDSIIRAKDSNSNFTARGGQSEETRLLECLDNTCAIDDDCASALDKNGQADQSRCLNGLCTPCYEEQSWLKVSLVLKDENVQIPDPELQLWRLGDTRMEGTINKYCPDEDLQVPQVTLEKN